MSSVVTTNTSNVTHCSSKQANDQLSHHHNQFLIDNHHHNHHNRGLHEKSSDNILDHNNQNSNPHLMVKKSEENVPNTDVPGAGNSSNTIHCHCSNQQQQPLQQQSCNYPANNAPSATNQGELKTLNTGSSTSKCPTVIKSCHNTNTTTTTTTTTTTYNNSNNNIPKGVKRANDFVEQQGLTPVVISSAHPIACKVVPSSSSNLNLNSSVGSSSQKLSGEDLAQNSEGKTAEEADLIDEDESTFDYEPVLIKILNEKKLALSKSPDVIKFLASFRELQQHQIERQMKNSR